MNAMITDIKRFAIHDGNGIRTTVFFKGCPLRCVWCHNPEGLSFSRELALYADTCTGCGTCTRICSHGVHRFVNSSHTIDRSLCVHCGACEETCAAKAVRIYGRSISVDELLPLLTEDKPFYDNSGGGVTLSGGEALCQVDFCEKLLKKLKEQGIHTAVDTCGAVPRTAFERVLSYTDVFLYDIKAINEAVHLRCTGHSNKQVLENLAFLVENRCDIEIRYPFVPGWNDTEVEAIAEHLESLREGMRIRVLPYHRYAGSKYASLGKECTFPETLPKDAQLERARACFRARGLRVL